MKITEKVLKKRSRNDIKCNKVLNLSGLGIGQIQGLERCYSLEELDISNNCIEELDGIEPCRNLWNINCNNNKVCSMVGLAYFYALGMVDLSNNNLTWESLARIQNIIILDLRLHGNAELEKDMYYRLHVIDCLPNIWMLDGIAVTSSERLQVQNFFEQSALSSKPIRRKLTKRPFTSRRKCGLSPGQRTIDVMAKFPTHETLSSDTDSRRLIYLSQNFDTDYLLTINTSSDETAIDFANLISYRSHGREKCNMLLLLLVSTLEFDLPPMLTMDTLAITKLDSYGDCDTTKLFLLTRPHRIQVISLLLSACKLDRDNKVDSGGLYDRLYLCLYYTFIKMIREETKQKRISACYASRPRTAPHLCNRTAYSKLISSFQRQDHKRLLASEMVLLLSVVPSFYRYVESDDNVQSLLRCATGDNSICNRLMQISKDIRQQGNDVSRVYQEISSHIANEIENHAYNSFLQLEKPNASMTTKSANEQQEWKIILDTPNAYPRRPKSAVLSVGEHLASGKKREANCYTRSQSAKRDPKNRLMLGSKVLLGPQNIAHVIAMPDADVALVQMNSVPTINGSVVINTNNSEDHYCYVDVTKLEFDERILCWKPQNAVGDRITLQRQLYETENTNSRIIQPGNVSPSNKMASTSPSPRQTVASPRSSRMMMLSDEVEGEEEVVKEEDFARESENKIPQNLSSMFKEKMDLKLSSQCSSQWSGTMIHEDISFTSFSSAGTKKDKTQSAISDYHKVLPIGDENVQNHRQSEEQLGEKIADGSFPAEDVKDGSELIDVAEAQENIITHEVKDEQNESNNEENNETSVSNKDTIPSVNIQILSMSETNRDSVSAIAKRRAMSARDPQKTKIAIDRPKSAVNKKRPDSASSFQLERTEAWRSSASTLSVMNVNMDGKNQVQQNPPPQRPTSPLGATNKIATKKLFPFQNILSSREKQENVKASSIKSVNNWLAEGKDLHKDYKKSRVYMSPRLPGYIDTKSTLAKYGATSPGYLLQARLPLTTTSLALHTLRPQKQPRQKRAASGSSNNKKLPPGPALLTKSPSNRSQFSHLNSIKKLHSKPHQTYFKR